MSHRFYYGASYSPLVFPESAWSHDLDKMRTAGMNLIRLGDVHGSWDLIEPEPGKYQLAELDKFYQLASEYEIDILISTGASGPPLWLAKKYPDLTILNSRGERYPLGASYHWACIHHPGYREALGKYIRVLVGFISKHPNHFGWQISNEIGFPFLPPRGENHLGLFCYCKHCQERFRNWVLEKYGDLKALTEAWAWGTTYYVYNDWSDVFPPESPPSAWASVTRWIDWRLFWQAAFSKFAGWQHDLIKQDDPDHPTSVNTFNFKGFDRFGVFTGLDQWQLKDAVDHIGYDLYPGSGNKLETRSEHTSMFLDHGRSVAKSNDRDFWLHEIESGPIGGWVMGPDHRTDDLDIEQYCVESLGHNAKLMLFMPWREWAYQPLHWGALVDLDGNPTPRLKAAERMGQFISDNNSFLKKASVPSAEIAILESKKNAIFFRGVDQEEELFLAQRGVYRAVWEKGFSIDFINETQLRKKQHFDYREILLPMMGLIDKDTAHSLAKFVHEGGLLVGFARCGTLDGNGWFYHQWPGASLSDVFGIRSLEPDTLAEDQIIFNNQSYAPYWNRDLLTLLDNAEILAEFKDGFPAVTLNKYGAGYGLYFATQADAGHIKKSPSLFADVLAVVHQRIGLMPEFRIIKPDIQHREIDFHRLDLKQQSLLLVTDYLEYEKEIQVVLKLNKKAAIIDLVYPCQASVEWYQMGDQLFLTFNNGPKEVKIFRINWE